MRPTPLESSSCTSVISAFMRSELSLVPMVQFVNQDLFIIISTVGSENASDPRRLKIKVIFCGVKPGIR